MDEFWEKLCGTDGKVTLNLSDYLRQRMIEAAEKESYRRRIDALKQELAEAKAGGGRGQSSEQNA